MENHPIPQDVTGFKFRLIGSVTVKQFLYILAAGALCGVFFIMPIAFLIKWPAILIIAGIGAALAFLPIEGRPMDVMLLNFLKALPAENRYLFHKEGAKALLHDYFEPQVIKKIEPISTVSQKDSRRELLLNQLVRKNVPYKADIEEREQMQNISGMFEDSNTPVTGMVSVEPNQEPARVEVATPTVGPTPINADTSPQESSPSEPTVETPPINETPAVSPVVTVPLPPAEPQTVVQAEGTPGVAVAPEDQLQSGFPQIPDTPNVVLGIVKDARGKVLPNIIVEVVDSTGSPVRAFKTNALGQFASATPLNEGQYKILLEDTRHIHEFSPIDIDINNEIFQPLVIISTDQREKLRQELFGTQ